MIVCLCIGDICLGNHHVRFGQGQPPHDLVKVGSTINARLAPQLDLVINPLVCQEVCLGKVEKLELAQNVEVYPRSTEGGLFRCSLETVGGGTDTGLLPLHLVLVGIAPKKVLAKAQLCGLGS